MNLASDQGYNSDADLWSGASQREKQLSRRVQRLEEQLKEQVDRVRKRVNDMAERLKRLKKTQVYQQRPSAYPPPGVPPGVQVGLPPPQSAYTMHYPQYYPPGPQSYPPACGIEHYPSVPQGNPFAPVNKYYINNYNS